MHSWSFRNKRKEDPSFDIFKILETTADMGFTAIEIMTGKANCPPDDIGPEDMVHLRSVVKRAEQLGIKITCSATYNDFAYVKDEAWRLANIEYIKRWLKISGDLGIPNIRMLTGYLVPGEDNARLTKLVEDGIMECIPAAEGAGVNMAVENHSSVIFSAEDIVCLIRKSGSKRLTTCPDPSNWNQNFLKPDCSAQEKDEIYKSVEKVAPYMTNSHLKIKGVADGSSIVGFDLDRLLSIYHKAGYKGGISFESVADGDLLTPLQKAREIVEAAIERVTGKN
jgi:sugar phosphate isomerase/epimerase